MTNLLHAIAVGMEVLTAIAAAAAGQPASVHISYKGVGYDVAVTRSPMS